MKTIHPLLAITSHIQNGGRGACLSGTHPYFTFWPKGKPAYSRRVLIRGFTINIQFVHLYSCLLFPKKIKEGSCVQPMVIIGINV